MPAIPMQQIEKESTYRRYHVPWLAGVSTVAMVVSLAGLSTATAGSASAVSSFGDVTASVPFASDISWLKASGISRGYADGDFRPDASLSRGAAAVFLYRLAGSPSVSSADVDAVGRRFTDLGDRTEFVEAIAWMSGLHITSGYANKTFRLNSAVTRGAMAAFLYRYSTLETDAPAGNYVRGTFRDVSTAKPFAGDIAWLAAAGATWNASLPITHGYPDKRYRPDSTLRRGAAAALLHRIVEAAAADRPTTIKAAHVWTVTTLAGSSEGGYVDATGAAASFHGPFGIAADSTGDVYVADMGNHVIRKVTPGGVVTTFAGSGAGGYEDGTGTAASFNFPQGVALDSTGDVYVADTGNHVIRRITPGGDVTIFAGSGSYGFKDGAGTAAVFNAPSGVAVDSVGNVYVADSGNNRIRKVTPDGDVTTFAGSGSYGFKDGAGTAAVFRIPSGVAVDSVGNVYVADSGNNRIRKITPDGDVTTLAGSGDYGFKDGAGTAASFNAPSGVAVDSAGNVYVADYGNNMIRKITRDGVVTTLAGSSDGGFKDGAGTVASFTAPSGVAVDSDGHVYVADLGNNRVREMQ